MRKMASSRSLTAPVRTTAPTEADLCACRRQTRSLLPASEARSGLILTKSAELRNGKASSLLVFLLAVLIQHKHFHLVFTLGPPVRRRRKGVRR